MSIMAVRPVRSTDRLADEPTITLPTTTGDCPTWCPGGCGDLDGARFHSRHVITVDGRDVDTPASMPSRMSAAVDLEAYNSTDGATDDPASVVVTLMPPPGNVDFSKLDDLDPGTIRYLAAAHLSGALGGERVQLTPEQAVTLGTALVQAGRTAGAV